MELKKSVEKSVGKLVEKLVGKQGAKNNFQYHCEIVVHSFEQGY